MSKGKTDRGGLLIRSGQPLIGVIKREDGQWVTRYFTEEQRKAGQAAHQGRIQRAARLAGAWQDLDWDEMEQALHSTRHPSEPTPPITEG